MSKRHFWEKNPIEKNPSLPNYESNYEPFSKIPHKRKKAVGFFSRNDAYWLPKLSLEFLSKNGIFFQKWNFFSKLEFFSKIGIFFQKWRLLTRA